MPDFEISLTPRIRSNMYISLKKKYGFFHFLWDCFMIVATCGLWLVWIFVREMRNP